MSKTKCTAAVESVSAPPNGHYPTCVLNDDAALYLAAVGRGSRVGGHFATAGLARRPHTRTGLVAR